MKVTGGQIQGGAVKSFHDHRIAMSFAVAGALAQTEVVITDCDNVATSFPNFLTLANQVGLNINE